MLAAIYPTKDSDPNRYLTLLSSSDGLTWSKPERNVVREGNFALDTQSQAFWDRDRKSYVLFTRMGPSGLAGQPVRLRMVMRDCRLYAFQFSNKSP